MAQSDRTSSSWTMAHDLIVPGSLMSTCCRTLLSAWGGHQRPDLNPNLSNMLNELQTALSRHPVLQATLQELAKAVTEEWLNLPIQTLIGTIRRRSHHMNQYTLLRVGFFTMNLFWGSFDISETIILTGDLTDYWSRVACWHCVAHDNRLLFIKNDFKKHCLWLYQQMHTI